MHRLGDGGALSATGELYVATVGDEIYAIPRLGKSTTADITMVMRATVGVELNVSAPLKVCTHSQRYGGATMMAAAMMAAARSYDDGSPMHHCALRWRDRAKIPRCSNAVQMLPAR